MERSRLTLRIPEKTKQRVEYFAADADISINDFILDALDDKIARLNGQIPDVDNIVVDRLNELIDRTASLSTDVSNLTVVSTNGFESIVRMARGGNFLMEDDNNGR